MNECEYCNTTNINKRGRSFFKGEWDGFYISQKRNSFYINYLKHYKDVNEGIEINYCPMCARKLK